MRGRVQQTRDLPSPKERPIDPFQPASRRSTVYGRRGMVASSQPLAVRAGLEILDAGGNAADAAVACAAALAVTEPCSNGIGGDAFALFYDAASGQVSALNGSGRSPAALDIARLEREGLAGGGEIPPFHAHTVTVPGACAAWADLVAAKGRLSLERVLAPAIELAESGFPVAPITAYSWDLGCRHSLAKAPNFRELTLDGRAPGAGEIFRNPGLARTLRAVAEGGAAAYYQGAIAEAIASVVALAGGCMTVQDLAAHESRWEQPIHADYRGMRVWECPPNGQGLAALLGLNLLQGFELQAMPYGSRARFHHQIESMRLAFADARQFVADPESNPAPLAALLSEDYATERRALIDASRARPDQAAGAPQRGSDTVYLAAADEAGNGCSFIQSNYMGFGTGIVPKGWGFTLQNRGHGFDLDADQPNALAPGKRPYHTIIPGLLTRPEGRREQLAGVFGVMGGFMQPQGHLQVVCNLVDDGLDPQAALDRPRFCIEDGKAGGRVALEEGISLSVMSELARMGHAIRPVSGHARAVFGRGQIILRDPESGVLAGGSDPRADGCAMTR